MDARKREEVGEQEQLRLESELIVQQWEHDAQLNVLNQTILK